MKIKTQDLTGTELDQAVADCLGIPTDLSRSGRCYFDSHAYPKFLNIYDDDNRRQLFSPSTSWSQAGVIIVEERINIEDNGPEGWQAFKRRGATAIYGDGPTPLVAAMRCYVASKLGDEIEVPDEVTA